MYNVHSTVSFSTELVYMLNGYTCAQCVNIYYVLLVVNKYLFRNVLLQIFCQYTENISVNKMNFIKKTFSNYKTAVEICLKPPCDKDADTVNFSRFSMS